MPAWTHATNDIAAIEEPEQSKVCIDLKHHKEDWLAASTYAQEPGFGLKLSVER